MHFNIITTSVFSQSIAHLVRFGRTVKLVKYFPASTKITKNNWDIRILATQQHFLSLSLSLFYLSFFLPCFRACQMFESHVLVNLFHGSQCFYQRTKQNYMTKFDPNLPSTTTIDYLSSPFRYYNQV